MHWWLCLLIQGAAECVKTVSTLQLWLHWYSSLVYMCLIVNTTTIYTEGQFGTGPSVFIKEVSSMQRQFCTYKLCMSLNVLKWSTGIARFHWWGSHNYMAISLYGSSLLTYSYVAPLHETQPPYSTNLFVWTAVSPATIPYTAASSGSHL